MKTQQPEVKHNCDTYLVIDARRCQITAKTINIEVYFSTLVN